MSRHGLLIVSVLLVAGWNGMKLNAAELAITTASPIGATVGAPYSQTFAATGGISPYTWSVQSGTLPSGLWLSPTGLLSGTPTQSGLSNFTVAVTDSSGGSASNAFSLIVALPPTPIVSITGLTDTVSPAQQPAFDVQLSSAYWLDITGSVTLTFEPNAVNESDDPSIQFSAGGRTLNFTIPAGQTTASWASPPAVQAGTVAGLLKLGIKFSAAGLNLTPILAPVHSVTVALAAPQIDSVRVVRTTGGFNLQIAGYSTPREVTQATFDFTTTHGGNSQTTSLTASVTNTFTNWYTSDSATQYGSVFLYTQPFTVQGNVSDIASVSVTLSNSVGTSSAVSASF
jgi:hypothetical protein